MNGLTTTHTTKTLSIASDGKVGYAGLDAIERRIVTRLIREIRRSRLFAGEIASLLGIALEFVDGIPVGGERLDADRDPLGWLDLRYGEPHYPVTPDPAGGGPAHFTKKAGLADAYGHGDPFFYELDPAGLSLAEQAILRIFLPGERFCGNSQWDRYFLAQILAAQEVARRLGLTARFDSELS